MPATIENPAWRKPSDKPPAPGKEIQHRKSRAWTGHTTRAVLGHLVHHDGGASRLTPDHGGVNEKLGSKAIEGSIASATTN